MYPGMLRQAHTCGCVSMVDNVVLDGPLIFGAYRHSDILLQFTVVNIPYIRMKGIMFSVIGSCNIKKPMFTVRTCCVCVTRSIV